MDNTLLVSINSSNKKTILYSIGILLCISVFLWFTENYFYNAIYGPFPKTKQELNSIVDFSAEKQRYIQIVGDKIYDSGIEQTEKVVDKNTKRVEKETTVGYYQVLQLDEKFLILYSSTPDSNVQNVGELKALSADVREAIVNSAGMENANWLLPYILDTNSYSTLAYVGLGIMVPATIFSLLNLFLAVRRLIDPTKHPFYSAFENEVTWLQLHQGTEYGNLAPACEFCTYHKPLIHSAYRRNVSYFFQREEASIQGNYCFSCNSRLFLRFTSVTLFGTWWGIIGFFVGPIYILQNIYNYFKVLFQSIRNT